jgi:hypothetical protein
MTNRDPITPERLAEITDQYEDFPDTLELLLELLAVGMSGWQINPHARDSWIKQLTLYQADHVALLAEVHRLTTTIDQIAALEVHGGEFIDAVQLYAILDKPIPATIDHAANLREQA